MDINCTNCGSGFKIPDSKIPPGKTATFLCPKCKSKVSVKAPEAEPAAKKPPPPRESSIDDFDFETDENAGDDQKEDARESFGFDEEADKPSVKSSSERAFDFAEEEGKTAIVLLTNSQFKKNIISDLGLLEYHVTIVTNTREAIRNLRYGKYNMVVMEEEFDGQQPDNNSILIFLARMPMEERRGMLICLLTNRYETRDYMMTLNKSVDLLINSQHVKKSFARLVSRGIKDHDYFYRVFNESRKAAGLAV